MLDRSLPYYGVIMIKPRPQPFPRFSLPAGYRICGYQPGDEAAWGKLMYSLGQTDSLQQAEEIFAREFLSQPQWLYDRCLFVKNAEGAVSASASLWQGEHFGSPLLRIHWVAVWEEEQGKGLAKALLTRLLELSEQYAPESPLYLTSQTWSYKAIHLYKRFGFLPYLGPKPTNWQEENFKCSAQTAWQIIEQKINETRG